MSLDPVAAAVAVEGAALEMEMGAAVECDILVVLVSPFSVLGSR